MTLDVLNIATVSAEIVLLLLLSLVMLLDLFSANRARLVHLTSVVGLLMIAAWQVLEIGSITPTIGMNGLVVMDPMGAFLKASAALATAVTLVYARRTIADQEMGFGEFHLFALFSLLGGFVMISANHLLTIYMGVELLSLSLYAAVALRRESAVSTEAAMKYFVLGALASGFLLYGMSMIYGATGSLEITAIQDKVAAGSADRLVMVFGTVFLVAGLAFKLGVVPFHMWVPDVYQGAPTATTLLIGAAPKFAAFAITIRLLVSCLIGVAADWQQMLLVLCVLSLLVGNLVALVQTNIKRVLAYSTIAHMGFMLLAIASGVLGAAAPRAAPVERLRAEARAAGDGSFGGWDAEDYEEDSSGSKPPARVGSPASFGGASSAGASAFVSATSSAAGSVGGGSQSGRDSPVRERTTTQKQGESKWDAADDDWGDDDDWGK